jgi:hypothetical protein
MVSRVAILTLSAVILMPQPGALATDANGLFWYFQRTGYTTATSSQTALAMGDSKSWPVVFSLANGSTQAFALTPVRNFSTNTYWNQIGTNILTGTGTLTAKSSSDGRVGASIANSTSSYYYYGFSGTAGSAIVGRRSTGFASPISNVQGIAFDQAGAVVPASVDTLAGSGINQFSLPTVQSIATSDFGSIGVLTSTSGLLSYYEKSPLTGWSSTFITSGTIAGGDLAIDTIGRPFVAYSTPVSSGWGVAASHFDIMSGQWRSSTFNVPGMSSPVTPTIAADGIGGIGVAWMASVSGSNSLMYAYKNGVKDWAIHTVTSLAVSSGTSFNPLLPQQRVGLDFDAQNWPVISFLGSNGSSADIWIAYDPIVVPEPSAVALAAAGFAGMCYAARRKRGR